LWVSKYLGGRRVGVLGDQDVETEDFDIEVKHGDQVTKWFTDSWEQAETNCREGQIPLLYIHPTRWRYVDGLVVLRAEDFKELLKIEDSTQGE